MRYLLLVLLLASCDIGNWRIKPMVAYTVGSWDSDRSGTGSVKHWPYSYADTGSGDSWGATLGFELLPPPPPLVLRLDPTDRIHIREYGMDWIEALILNQQPQQVPAELPLAEPLPPEPEPEEEIDRWVQLIEVMKNGWTQGGLIALALFTVLYWIHRRKRSRQAGTA